MKISDISSLPNTNKNIKPKLKLLFIQASLFLIAIPCSYHQIPARIFGCIIAAYSAIANDSIQTLGTLIAANKDIKWYQLFIYIGAIYVIVTSVGYVVYNGDISQGRLTAKGLNYDPVYFSYLQVAAPIVLLILTKMAIPVSTTFLILTSFANKAKTLGSMITKSLYGFLIAFAVSQLFYYILGVFVKKFWGGYGRELKFKKSITAEHFWRIANWLSSGWLWTTWLMQNNANYAVQLPRSMGLDQFFFILLFVFIALGLLLFKGGEEIQKIVDRKSRITNHKEVFVINLIYALILYIFKEASNIPMSTTFVFIGLLGGREISLAINKAGKRSIKEAILLFVNDSIKVGIGFIISLILGIASNEALRISLFGK